MAWRRRVRRVEGGEARRGFAGNFVVGELLEAR